MAQFTIEAQLTYRSTVTVEASDEDVAYEKFDALEWIDSGLPGAELTDWESHGEPKRED